MLSPFCKRNLLALMVDESFDVFADDANTFFILSSLRNDDVGISFCGLNKLFVHRF